MYFPGMQGREFLSSSRNWLTAACAVGILAFASAASAVTLYSTTFSNPPFDPTAFYWAGVEGWQATDPNNGSAAVGNNGGVVYLGYVAPADTVSIVERAFNLDPVAINLPIVKIRTRLAIDHSTNGFSDVFGFGIYNRAGNLVCSVLLDNWDGGLYYDPGTGPQALGLYFSNGFFLEVSLTLNFATNRASLSFFDAAGTEHPAFQNATLNKTGASLDFATFDYLWLLSSATAGDNAMVIDSLSVEASANPTLTFSKGKMQRAKRDTYVLRGGQAAGDDVRVEWKSKTQRRWTAVRGSATSWTIRLRKLRKGRNIVQLRMLDALGRTIDQKRIVVVRK
jgi:hypothetical protein